MLFHSVGEEEGQHQVDALLIASALLAALYARADPGSAHLVRALGVACALSSRLRSRPEPWLALATLQLMGVAVSWGSCDNHQYFIGYWMLSVCLGLYGQGGRASAAEIIGRSGQVLVGLVMLFAVVAKLLSDDYVSGDFMSVTVLTDPRFRVVAELAGGVSELSMLENYQKIDGMRRGAVSTATLAGTDAVAGVAWFLTWWTVGIEGLLALLFLGASRARMLRHLVLSVFVVTTPAVSSIERRWSRAQVPIPA